MTKYYRFDSHVVGIETDNLFGPIGVRVSVFVNEYPVIKETRKGVWLDVYGTKKFVLNNSIKKWAYPYKDAALQSFVKRKQRQVEILQFQLNHAKEALKVASENDNPERFEPSYIALSFGEL